MTLVIDEETPDDHAEVAMLVARAFGRADEALLINALRAAGDLALSLVARSGAGIVGHIAFQPLATAAADGKPRCASLAPLAVMPGHQHKGIGTGLVREGVARLKVLAFDVVFVLGDPAYYSRFGFDASAARGWSVPWAGEHFQALWLSPPPHAAPRALIYPPAFKGVA